MGGCPKATTAERPYFAKRYGVRFLHVLYNRTVVTEAVMSNRTCNEEVSPC